MPKTTNDLDNQIQAIAAHFTRDIAAAIKKAIADQILGVGVGGAAPRGKPAAKTPAKKVAKALAPRPCPVCGKPGKGPRFGFHCEEHKSLHKPKGDAKPAKASLPKKAKAKAKPKAAKKQK